MAVKILVYAHSFWPAIGGAETYARLLAEGVSADNAFRQTIVTQTPYQGLDAGLQCDIVRRPGLWHLWRLVRSADLIFSTGPALAPMLLAAMARKPFVVEHHGYQAICPNGLLLNKARGGICELAFRNKRYGECYRCCRVKGGRARPLVQLGLTFLRRYLCRKADAHVAVSHHVRGRHDLERMQVIYHGVPKLEPLARVVADRDDTVHFGYVGRLVEEKGLPLLVEAAGKLKSQGVLFRLSFVGDGPLRAALVKQAETEGLNAEIRFTGFLEGPSLQRAVSELDVVVMPSVWEETAGLAAMEQMMRGRVVLAADIGGLGEIVGDGGIKFRPFDLKDLADRMLELANPEIRSRIATAARARAGRLFGLERMVDDHKALFRDAIAAHRRAGANRTASLPTTKKPANYVR